jgi:hypothetical protein
MCRAAQRDEEIIFICSPSKGMMAYSTVFSDTVASIQSVPADLSSPGGDGRISAPSAKHMEHDANAENRRPNKQRQVYQIMKGACI